VFERSLGPDHYEVAITCNNLAGVVADRVELGEAEQLYRRALRIKEQLLGPDHPDVATTLLGLGSLIANRGLLERACAISRSSLPAGHPKVVLAEDALASMHEG
jgi:hypothetical protein